MKLLIFHPALAPYRIDFFNALAKRFETELVLFDKNLVNQKFDQTALSKKIICPISYLLKGFRWKDRYFRTGAIRKLIKCRPNTVLVSEYGLVPIVMAICKILSFGGFKLYTIVDDNLHMFNTKPWMKRVLRWLFVRIYDGIIVTNNEVSEAYRKITPQGRKIVFPVVPILHNLNKIRANAGVVITKGMAWRKAKVGRFEKVLLFVGRLDPEKNVSWLVDQVRSLPDKTCLVFVGSGSMEDVLKTQVKELGCENIFFAGRLEGESVYSMMAMADALVLPSDFEPYGAVVGESLQWGTPCLVSDHVGAKALIDDKSKGAIFLYNDADDFAAKLEEVLKLKSGSEALIGDELTGSVEEAI